MEEKIKKERSPQEVLKRKKMIVFPLFVLAFAAVIWLIFSPSKEEKQKLNDKVGINTNIPQAKANALADSKEAEYEKASAEQQQDQRSKTMQDLAGFFGITKENSQDEGDELGQSPNNTAGASEGKSNTRGTIRSSARAYKEINRNLDNFYQDDKDKEKKELQDKVDQLQAQMRESNNGNSVEEKMKLLEKSYEMAARLMPQNMNQKNENTAEKEQETKTRGGKTKVEPIYQVKKEVVSSLSNEFPFENMTNGTEHNLGFNTSVGESKAVVKNTIKACVHIDQTITDGQTIRLRLLESLKAGSTIIPENSTISGKTFLVGERLNIIISGIEYQGKIIPVELNVFDTDGQIGIFVPGSMEVSAIKDVAGNVGNSIGTSFNITKNAGEQITADLTKALIQGGSQYISKKARLVKIHLKAGYQVFLTTKE